MTLDTASNIEEFEQAVINEGFEIYPRANYTDDTFIQEVYKGGVFAWDIRDNSDFLLDACWTPQELKDIFNSQEFVFFKD